MNTLEVLLAEVRANLASAADFVALAKRRGRGLPSSSIEGRDWGEQRQKFDEALDAADAAIRAARGALE